MAKSRDDKPSITRRQQVKAAAANGGVELSVYDRALVLGQLAEFLSKHPKVGDRVAFKGGTIMTLVEKSPRMSKDLDSSLVLRSGRRVTLDDVVAALTTQEARRVVRRVDVMQATSSSTQLNVPVIVCNPQSGVDEVSVGFSVHWSESMLMAPVREAVEIDGRAIKLLVMARPERVAEKLLTLLNRKEHRDAFDLYLYATERMTRDDWTRLSSLSLVVRKLDSDPKAPHGAQAKIEFDKAMRSLSSTWDVRNPLRLLATKLPAWSVVEPVLSRFRAYLP